ncbi:mitotic deacetylase-associated SANT domain protein isoform X2 [Chiloscyllium plagiosum]|uniref:mitotic deacetylase-associated SANT domain protein isoform X2 n=1 Tax=Chiloscyllium plagiosum TaxID=36176 RepID=UPI001CB8808E|nr:mitotic deacetylase-associated SANT domain protein isoform X2 [Chiloscyllium plagiosum]
MNRQATGKSSAKRKGKQISFFGENTGTVQPSPSRLRKNGMIRGEAEGGPLKSQPPTLPETPARGGQCQSVGSDLAMSQGRAVATGSTMPPNWAASVLIDRLPSKGSFSWQPAGSWTQSAAPFCASVGAVSIIDSNATGPFSQALAKQGAAAQPQKQQHRQTQLPLQTQQQQQNQLKQHLQTQQSNQLQQKQHQLQQQHAQAQQSDQLQSNQHQLQQQHAQAQQSNQLQSNQHQLQQQHAQAQQSNQHQIQQQHAQAHKSNQHQLQQQHAQAQQSNQLQSNQHQLQQQHAEAQQSNQRQLQQQHAQTQQSNQLQSNQHQLQQQHAQAQQLNQRQLQQQHTQAQQSNQLQSNQQIFQQQHAQTQQSSQLQQKQHQLQQQHAQAQQSSQLQQKQHQLQQQHAQAQQSNQLQQKQHQLQQQHAQTQQQNQLQQQYQQSQLLHQHQQQQSNEVLPQRQFFQYQYGQNQKQELPPNSVLNIFHQVHQPALLPLYSHQAQTTCQQHLFQQFFPHQQPPQSLGLQRVQVSQGSEASMHHVVSTAAPFQQQLAEVHVSKGLQRSTLGGIKQEHIAPRQLTAEFQAPAAKRAHYPIKERQAKPPPFEAHRVGNPAGSTESASQRWPQAYGPELQKLLNVPPSHSGQSQLKLFEAAPPRGGESWSRREQESREPARETASRGESTADSLVQLSTKKEETSGEESGPQPHQESAEALSNWTTSAKTGESDSQEERQSVVAGHPKVLAGSACSRSQVDDSCLQPLVIPVSVPVRKLDPVSTSTDKKEDGESPRNSANERDLSELNPSLLPTRRRRLSKGSGTEHLAQENASSRGHVNLTAKLKRRPRPEPLFIPPKPLNHVSVITYPPGTLYQSNLRSPVRLLDHPMDKNFQPPPYTPPPILSPMREGSGLYFNAFLSSSSASSQPVTPRSTPKACLSQSNSVDTPPPVLSLMSEVTPASIEPRINIGPQFQAEIPGLRDWSLAAADASHADLVFKPWEGHKMTLLNQQKVDDLMTLACSSILPGGGTNQELTLHCLHESKGNILSALNMLLIKKTPRGRSKALLSYHYAGSDKWTSTEKKMFNKGLAAHKKDFFLVQKLVKTKTVAQCVEFYYTYKKQVKIGRNGALIFGDASDNKSEDEPVEVDRKDSLPRRTRALYTTEVKEEEDEEEDEDEDEEEDEEDDEEEEEEDGRVHKKLILPQAKVVKTEQTPAASQGVHLRKNPDPTYRCSYRPRQPSLAMAPPRMPARSEQAQSGASAKHAKQTQENIFPCKKCGKVFFKVKSRSAHMKSHSVQEKKQREAELKNRVTEDEQREEQEKYSDYSDSYQDV